MQYVRLLLAGVYSAVLMSCVYEKGYNPTFWDYSVSSSNKLQQTVYSFRVEKEGYDRLLVMEHEMPARSGQSVYLGTNLPLRGIAYATWKVGGKNYEQTIDLDQFKLNSFRDGTLKFQFNSVDRVDVSIEP